MNRIALGWTLAALAALPAASSANLVLNPGFETYNTALASGSGPGYSTYTANGQGIANWTVGLTSVDIVNVPYMLHDGSAALDLAGTPGPGSIAQAIATTPLTSYVVSFYGKQVGESGVNANVMAGFGPGSKAFTLTNAYQLYTFTATANSASSLLSLSTDLGNNTNGNLLVDSVSVEAVPEPTTVAALGLGALGVLRRRTKRA